MLMVGSFSPNSYNKPCSCNDFGPKLPSRCAVGAHVHLYDPGRTEGESFRASTLTAIWDTTNRC